MRVLRSVCALGGRAPEPGQSLTLGRRAVADPSGGWLDAWAGRLRRCGASHVRTPNTAVPLPSPLALRSFAERTRRTAELAASSPRFVAVPSLALYADGCADALGRMPASKARLRSTTVTRLVRCHLTLYRACRFVC